MDWFLYDRDVSHEKVMPVVIRLAKLVLVMPVNNATLDQSIQKQPPEVFHKKAVLVHCSYNTCVGVSFYKAKAFRSTTWNNRT